MAAAPVLRPSREEWENPHAYLSQVIASVEECAPPPLPALPTQTPGGAEI